MNLFFWFWVAIAASTVILEIATSSALISIWFTVGALVALVLTLLDFAFWIQVVAFLAVSIILVYALRPIAKRLSRGSFVATNADRLIGMRTKLVEDITTDSLGLIKFNGILWNAKSINDTEIPKGSEVEILALEGSKVIVKKID